MSLKIPSLHYNTLIHNTTLRNGVINETFYHSLAKPFETLPEVQHLVKEWNDLAAKPVQKVFGIFNPLPLHQLQYEIVLEMLAIGLGLLTIGTQWQKGFDNILDAFINRISVFEPVVIPEISLAYGYMLASNEFSKKRPLAQDTVEKLEIEFSLFKSMELMYPIFSKYNRSDLSSVVNSLPMPLPYSNLYKQVKDVFNIVDEEKTRIDTTHTEIKGIKAQEFEYKLEIEGLIERLGAVNYLGEAIPYAETLKKDFLSFYLGAVNAEPLKTINVGTKFFRTEDIRLAFLRAAIVFARIEPAKMKNTYINGENYFGNIETFNTSLEKIKGDYVFLATNDDINEKQKDLEEDVALKVGFFYLSLVPILKESALLNANKNLGDLLRYWSINQENKKEVVAEIDTQNIAQETELQQENIARFEEGTEETIFSDYEQKRREIYASEYNELFKAMQKRLIETKTKIAFARNKQVENIAKKVAIEEQLEKIKLDKEFQEEIAIILENIS